MGFDDAYGLINPNGGSAGAGRIKEEVARVALVVPEEGEPVPVISKAVKGEHAA